MTDKGWICPRCNRVWAPKVESCAPCNGSAVAMPGPRIGTPLGPIGAVTWLRGDEPTVRAQGAPPNTGTPLGLRGTVTCLSNPQGNI